MKESPYRTLQGARGYVNKAVATLAPEEFLIGGSQNVFIEATEVQGQKTFVVKSREGYTIFGAEDTTLEPIGSEKVWRNSRGVETMLRKTNTNLQFYSTITSAWENLLTTLDGDYPARFAVVWNNTELIDELLFVNHSASLYSWTGAFGKLPNGDADVTATTVTIAETISDRGFLTSGTRSIMIKDTGGTWRTTAYTGQAGSQFTVSTDLSAFTFAANAPVVQVVRTNANIPASGFINDVIATAENQVYVGSHASRRVFISENDDYLDYALTSPRVPGDPAQLLLDDVCTGFELGPGQDGNDSMVIFAGRNYIYRMDFIATAGSTNYEMVKVKPIPIGANQGALSQELIGRTKNAVVFVNGDNELVELGSVENFSTLQYTPISDQIKTDFDATDFTNGQVKFKKNYIYVTAPVDSKVYIFDLVNRLWHSPMILPVRALSDYGGDLYGHSNSIKETYKMFDGVNDNGKPYTSRAVFAYRHYGTRETLKNFDRYFLEMFLTANAVVKQTLNYEYLGAKTSKEYQYKGIDSAYLIVSSGSASLGVNSLGTNPLGATVVGAENLLKYRRFKKVSAIDFFEYSAEYEMETDDSQFYIISQGANATESRNYPVKITN